MGTHAAVKIAGGHGTQVANAVMGISKLPFFSKKKYNIIYIIVG
jgi:hypothetical protein